MRARKPFAVDKAHSGNGARANTETFIFPMIFNDFALELTPFPGASPTHGQGTVTVCAPRNAIFASFSNDFEAFLVTVSGEINR